MNFKELEKSYLAIDYLAQHLIDGSLVLFLGAGISKGFGLPDWKEFADLFRKKMGLSSISMNNAEEIQTALEEAISKTNNDDEKIEIVKEILYSTSVLDVKIAYTNPLLISISSLLIGRKRGHVKRVITYNYDSILEWFLSLFGFQVNSIIDLPALEGSEDVRIYHPHGFVPHPALGLDNSNFIILGIEDANERMGARSDLWRDKTRQILEEGVCLFLGLSYEALTDRGVEPLLRDAGKKCKEIRPLGIWIYKDKNKLQKEQKDRFFNKNIVPIEIDEIHDIANFILGISQKALEKTKMI
ncbi:MAG: SIR2 family protein [Bacteroidales bacterium]|jgi:hypothetical protein|nr:SIR2 family protein [Bacteroidales bacterium]